jgi:hypothetical protein
MNEEVVTYVRIPIDEIERMVRSKHNLPDKMIDVRLETDYLLLYFANEDKANSLMSRTSSLSSTTFVGKKRKRRARRRRNRMKTRGWDAVARILNRKGQACAIYKPFVEALSQSMSAEEQRAVVTKILKSNGNRPSEASVNYFLENTLEYLSSRQNS